jgi:hypothetical protein
MSSKRCRIRFRSGDLISAVDEVTCDDEASVANKTKPDNQSLGVAVFVRLTGNTPQKGANNIAFARRTAIHLTGIMISPVGVKGQPFPLSPLLTHRIFPRMTGNSEVIHMPG